jgi:hypothetical protein
MATCYNCGKKIQEGEGVRREVYIGHSSSGGFSRRNFWASNRNNYGMRLLCQDCAKPSLMESFWAIVKAILLLIVLFEIFRSC